MKHHESEWIFVWIAVVTEGGNDCDPCETYTPKITVSPSVIVTPFREHLLNLKDFDVTVDFQHLFFFLYFSFPPRFLLFRDWGSQWGESNIKKVLNFGWARGACGFVIEGVSGGSQIEKSFKIEKLEIIIYLFIYLFYLFI